MSRKNSNLYNTMLYSIDSYSGLVVLTFLQDLGVEDGTGGEMMEPFGRMPAVMSRRMGDMTSQSLLTVAS
jgi:hypothetical protein